MMIFNVTDRYNPLEAFLFDFLVAEAVLGTLGEFKGDILASAGPSARILDVGCGGGQLALALEREGNGLSVTGLDLSLGQLGRARGRARKAGAQASFVRATALGLPFADESFDLVCSVDCLKHWPHRGVGLSECVRVLKPGGTLLLTEVDRKCPVRTGLRFVRQWNVPFFLKPFSLVPFFLFAVLRSVTREEALVLAQPLPLDGVRVETGPAGVNWTLKGTKRRNPAG